MEEFLIRAAQLIASLSILIVLHELGHFIPAKLFKTRVEKFYLFFNPGFSLFKIKRGDTEYGLGWLPLGGYVKISGMIDESMDKDAMKQEPKPYEFRAKPAWQRLIIMIGGVTVNLFLGYLIYSMVLFTWGKQMLPLENMTYGVHCDSLMYDYGFQEGDKIVKVGDSDNRYFSSVNKALLINGHSSILVERNGTQQAISIPADLDQLLLNKEVKRAFSPRHPFVIKSVQADSAADRAGLMPEDSVIGVNDSMNLFASEVVREIQSNKEKEVDVHFIRDGIEKTTTVKVNAQGLIGISYKNDLSFLEYEVFHYSFLESFPAGVTDANATLVDYVSSMKLVFTKEGVGQMGGFGAIGGLFPATWNWHSFWGLTAFLSLILAFMNILPIPALDGGHVMFLIYEMVTGRPPGDKFMEYAQMVGMGLLFALLLYANGNDVVKWITSW